MRESEMKGKRELSQPPKGQIQFLQAFIIVQRRWEINEENNSYTISRGLSKLLL